MFLFLISKFLHFTSRLWGLRKLLTVDCTPLGISSAPIYFPGGCGVVPLFMQAASLASAVRLANATRLANLSLPSGSFSTKYLQFMGL